jgi:hypothetical protein
MALVKGENGEVFDAVDSIASGLVGGGHAVYVDADGNEVKEPVSADEPAPDAPAGKGSKG